MTAYKGLTVVYISTLGETIEKKDHFVIVTILDVHESQESTKLKTPFRRRKIDFAYETDPTTKATTSNIQTFINIYFTKNNSTAAMS